ARASTCGPSSNIPQLLARYGACSSSSCPSVTDCRLSQFRQSKAAVCTTTRRQMAKRQAVLAGAIAIAVAGLAAGSAVGGSVAASAGADTTVKATALRALSPQLEAAPRDTYTPKAIRSAYGVDSVAPLASGAANYGQGQTIVLVDSYGSPTAAADLKHFHDTFFPSMPAPKFQEIYPLGNPQGKDCNGNGSQHSGTCAAAGWTGEATLDIEWAYSIAPEANIILLATPPAETLGVQGLPNLFKAISTEVTALPAGTVFSMSFGVTEQTFGGAAASQTAKFDAVFQQGLAKGDNFFTSSG